MLGKKSRPIIGKLSELLVSGNKTRFLNPIIPLDFRTSSSPKSLKRYDVGEVGLGIVAALEKSSFTDCCNRTVCSSNLNRSNPINISSGKDNDRFRGRIDDWEEDYTYVITHGPGKSSTKVYYNGDEQEQSETSTRHDTNGFDDVKETPEATFVEDSVYPSSDFLSYCHLCRKKLHGQDIYMYRGEKGFCSAECRSKQIMMDESKEFCRSKASRSAKVLTSLYNNNNTGQIFSSGIILAI